MRDINMLAEMIGFLGDSMTGGTDHAAERNGKHKQALAAASKRLPSHVDRDDRLVYEALGFRFGKVDGLFMEAEFPKGWDTKPTDHYMYTLIVDDRGRRRGQYMYKPDFWDRDSALWAAERRFRLERDWSDEIGRDEIVVLVKDAGREVYRTRVYRVEPKGDEKQWEVHERVEVEARTDALTWLRARFPEHENPLAYWSLPDEIDLTAFPKGCAFETGPSSVVFCTGPHGSCEIRVDPSGGHVENLRHMTDRSALAGIRRWAALLANQPADPRPKKGERR